MEWIILLLALSCLCYEAQSNHEVEALMEMKQMLNDTENQLSNWFQNQVTPCAFTFVICESSNVTKLILSSMGFTGTLSPRIGDLQYLTVLSLTDNKLTGEIPKEFGKLSKLIHLNLENNLLIGDILANLGSLSSLETLDLSGNKLSGSIPESISNISTLNNIGLAFNRLSGNIPDSLFNVATYNFTNNSLNCGENFSHPCISNFPSKGGTSTPNIKIILGSILAAIALLALAIAFVLYNLRKSKTLNPDNFHDVSGENEWKINLGQIKRFTLHELQSATEDFHEKNVLGQGGFGKVYKGIIFDDKNNPIKIAVKRLNDLEKHKKSGEESFLREIELISVANHKNLLRLVGFCVTSSERLLVYPFMENLSLASRLRDVKRGDVVLDWATRRRIALGTAQGLEYLHEQCDPKIIHRDVKAANVLLGTDLEAVVGDFGLARLVDTKKTSVTTQVRGTMGHIAPEYLRTGRSSEKTDVFGYGIMILELVTGQRAIDFDGYDEILLLDHVTKLLGENRLEDIVDSNLNRVYDVDGLERIIRIGLLCAQVKPERRPAMSEVVRMLEGEELGEIEIERDLNFEMAEFERFGFLDGNVNVNVNVEESLYIPDPIELSGGR